MQARGEANKLNYGVAFNCQYGYTSLALKDTANSKAIMVMLILTDFADDVPTMTKTSTEVNQSAVARTLGQPTTTQQLLRKYDVTTNNIRKYHTTICITYYSHYATLLKPQPQYTPDHKDTVRVCRGQSSGLQTAVVVLLLQLSWLRLRYISIIDHIRLSAALNTGTAIEDILSDRTTRQ